MLKFEHTYLDEDDKKSTVNMTWDSEEIDICEIVERFQKFLLAITYSVSLVERVIYLTDDQVAKLGLLGDNINDL